MLAETAAAGPLIRHLGSAWPTKAKTTAYDLVYKSPRRSRITVGITTRKRNVLH